MHVDAGCEIFLESKVSFIQIETFIEVRNDHFSINLYQFEAIFSAQKSVFTLHSISIAHAKGLIPLLFCKNLMGPHGCQEKFVFPLKEIICTMHIYNVSLWKYQKTLKQNVRKFPVVPALIPILLLRRVIEASTVIFETQTWLKVACHMF